MCSFFFVCEKLITWSGNGTGTETFKVETATAVNRYGSTKLIIQCSCAGTCWVTSLTTSTLPWSACVQVHVGEHLVPPVHHHGQAADQLHQQGQGHAQVCRTGQHAAFLLFPVLANRRSGGNGNLFGPSCFGTAFLF